MSVETIELSNRDIQFAYRSSEHAVKPKLGGELKTKISEQRYALRQACIPIDGALKDLEWDYTVKETKVNEDGTTTEVGKLLVVRGETVPNVFEMDNRGLARAVDQYLAETRSITVPLLTPDEWKKVNDAAEEDVSGLIVLVKKPS